MMLFEEEEDRTGYIGFPPFIQRNTEAPYIVDVNLSTTGDIIKFNELLDLNVPLSLNKCAINSKWYPELERGERGSSLRYMWCEVDDVI